jgi:hypothetical protein
MYFFLSAIVREFLSSHILNEGKILPLLFRHCDVFCFFVRISQAFSEPGWCYNVQNTIIAQYRILTIYKKKKVKSNLYVFFAESA